MAEVAEAAVPAAAEPGPPSPRPPRRGSASAGPASGGAGALVKKRWRAWLRAAHRDVGYLAVGFTIIYAVSGLAMNHLDDWDPNFHASEYQVTIAPIAPDAPDAAAVAAITAAAKIDGAPSDVFRAGDEVRLEYPSGSKVTAIGDTVTVQKREARFFLRVANWLHATRGKQAWKYIADAYAVLLLYLAISGIFMIKGKLGLRWRGSILIAVGLTAPVGYLVLSGGPEAHRTAPGDEKVSPGERTAPGPTAD